MRRGLRIARLAFVLALAVSVSGDVRVRPAGDVDPLAPARLALARGGYREAVAQARAASEGIEARHGPHSIESAHTLDVLVEALTRGGEAGAAGTLELGERVVHLKERLVPDSLDLAASLHLLGEVRDERGESASAQPLHERALAIRRRDLGPGHPAVADSLDHLALALIRQERFNEARQALEQSEAVRGAAGATSPLDAARTLGLVGLLNRYEGRYAAALDPVDRALALQRGFAPTHPDIASMLHARGDVVWLQGDIHGAQRAWADALTLGERSLGPAHPTIALFLRKLALAAEALGNLAEGRRLREQGLQIGEASLAPCHPERPNLMSDLAGSLAYDGEYVQAQTLYGRALEIYERCLGVNHSLTATVIHNQAILAHRMGDFTEAERLNQQAIDLWSSILQPNHPYVARALDALADALADRGLHDRAYALYSRALDVRRRALGPQHPEVAWTLANLARTVAATGDLSLAVSYVDQAVAIYERAGASDEPDHVARVLELAGTLQARQGRLGQARATLNEALAVRERTFGRVHPLIGGTLAERAKIELALGAPDQALVDALEAEKIGREHLQFTVRYLPERQAMAYAGARPRGLDVGLSVVAGEAGHDVAAVFDAVVRSRGLVLDELASRARSAVASDPDVTSLNAELVTARQRFANLALRSLQSDETVSPKLLEEARGQKEGAERALAARSALIRGELARTTIGLAEVRRSLPSGSALVSFVRYNAAPPRGSRASAGPAAEARPEYLALLLRSNIDRIDVVPLGSAASLETLITAWRTQVSGTALARVPLRQAEQAAREAGVRLRERLWDRIAARLPAVSQVFIVPDGAINLVNLAAMPIGRDRYLVEDLPVLHHLATERDLVPAAIHPGGRGLFAVGGPAYDDLPVRPQAASAALVEGPPGIDDAVSPAREVASLEGRRAGCGDQGRLHFAALPGTATEVQEIRRLWPAAGADVVVLTGREAGERAVKAGVAGRQIVHFATHGFFLGTDCQPALGGTRAVGRLSTASTRTLATAADNPLLLSGLALAHANRGSSGNVDEDDGILTAEEVAGLNLQATEWAVLSACETGIGEVRAGEGVFGLKRAFQIAGARTVIMSLWSVEDQATRAWMQALYQARLQQRLDTAQSIRWASLTMLGHRRRNGLSTHPFYWAAFVAAGDWR